MMTTSGAPALSTLTGAPSSYTTVSAGKTTQPVSPTAVKAIKPVRALSQTWMLC